MQPGVSELLKEVVALEQSIRKEKKDLKHLSVSQTHTHTDTDTETEAHDDAGRKEGGNREEERNEGGEEGQAEQRGEGREKKRDSVRVGEEDEKIEKIEATLEPQRKVTEGQVAGVREEIKKTKEGGHGKAESNVESERRPQEKQQDTQTLPQPLVHPSIPSAPSSSALSSRPSDSTLNVPKDICDHSRASSIGSDTGTDRDVIYDMTASAALRARARTGSDLSGVCESVSEMCESREGQEHGQVNTEEMAVKEEKLLKTESGTPEEVGEEKKKGTDKAVSSESGRKDEGEDKEIKSEGKSESDKQREEKNSDAVREKGTEKQTVERR